MARIAKPNTTPTQSETKANSKRKADWDAIVDDRTFDSFVVRTVKPAALNRSAPANKKRKTAKGAVDALAESTFSQRNPIKESHLSSVLYQIEPADVWARLDKYRRFTIEAEQFELNQYVFIKHGLDAGPSTTEVKDWVAKVLEVRGADSAHVFLRVAWMYRPEDLPGGRQHHHGACELVASNHIDVVDAKSVQHVADVIHWPDEDDDDEVPYQDQLFWRQSLDVTLSKSKRFSKLQNHCIDKAPRNPDEDLVYCPSCKTWLHARCLQDEAIKDASSSNSSTRQSFTATIRTLRSGKTALTVTDLRKSQNHRKWNVDVTCLKCNDTIERAKAYSEDDEDDDDGEELENVIGDNVTVTPASPTPGASSDDDSAVHLKHTEQADDLSTTGSVNQDAATTEPVSETGATTSIDHHSTFHSANDSVLDLINPSEPVSFTPPHDPPATSSRASNFFTERVRRFTSSWILTPPPKTAKQSF